MSADLELAPRTTSFGSAGNGNRTRVRTVFAFYAGAITVGILAAFVVALTG